MLPKNYNPEYYNLTAPVELTGDNTSLGSAFIGSGVDEFQKALKKEVEKLDPSFRKLTLKVLTRVPGVGNLVAREVEVAFNPQKERYTVGKFIIDTAGTAAVGAVLTAFAASVGIAGTSVIGVAAIGVGIGVGASLIWDGVKEAGDELLDIILGTVQTDIQILDTNNDVIGGAFVQEGLAEENELAAIEELLGQTIKNDLPFDNETLPPDIIAGENNIRIVRQNGFTDGENITYRVYDGELIDIISSEFDVTKEELLALGTANAPNTNEQISFLPILLNAPSYIFAADENRFYVPLPNVESVSNQVKGFHPGNIYYGTNGSDNLSVFENNTSFNSELETDNTLILGLEGDDFLSADVGTNFIFGGTGNDNISGIAGEDTVYFTDDFANYDYSIDDRGVITFTHARGTQADGTDTLIDIEQAQFKDRIVSLPLDNIENNIETEEGDEVTIVFRTTLNRNASNTNLINLPPEIFGENPFVEFIFTIEPDSFNADRQTYDIVSGEFKINDISLPPRTSRLNNELLVSNLDTPNFQVDGVSLGISELRNPTASSTPGYRLANINLSLVDADGNTLDNGALPSNWSSFANNVDEYTFGITLDNDDLPPIQIAANVTKEDPQISPFELFEVETSDEIPVEEAIEEETSNSQDDLESEQPPANEDEELTEEPSESEEPIPDEEEIVEPPVNEDEPDLEDPNSLIDKVPENNSPINNPQETEIQLQIFSPDLESAIIEPVTSVIRIQDEYTELSTLGLDTSDFVPVDVNIDLDFGTESGAIYFEVDENEGSGSFAPAEFNGYVFTDVFDEIPVIENVTLSETGNSLGLESSDITFTENTIEVNVESLAYSPGLNALLDVEFADL
jgi:Ca2+-binding RTX toxin-like protein